SSQASPNFCVGLRLDTRLIGFVFLMLGDGLSIRCLSAKAPTIATWLPDRRNFGSLSRRRSPRESFFDCPDESELAAADYTRQHARRRLLPRSWRLSAFDMRAAPAAFWQIGIEKTKHMRSLDGADAFPFL